MASTWIKVRTNLNRCSKVKGMARRLSVDHDLVAGKCVKFWSWADEETEDGSIDGVTAEDIDDHVDLPGFAAEMERVGWLAFRTGGIQIPDFKTYMTESTRKRIRNKSKGGEASAAKTGKRPDDDRQTSAQEEKRREESSTNQGGREPSQDWRAKSFAALSRAIGRQCDVSDDMHLERFVQTLPARVRIRDALHDRWQLVERALSETNVSADAQTARSAIKYAKKIIERCIQHEVWPGEFENEHGKPNKPNTRAAKGKQRYAGQVDDDVGEIPEI